MDNQQGNLQEEYMMDWCLERLAYSVGALLGDGSVKSHIVKRDHGMQTQYRVVIANMDEECVERVCKEINLFFEKDYAVVPYTNQNGTIMYRLSINNTLIHTTFRYFVEDKVVLPSEVFRATRQTQLDFLAGLFDTDGYIAQTKTPKAKYGYSWRVGFASRHRTFVEDLSRLLQRLSVEVGTIYTQTSGHNTQMFVIKPNIRSFLKAGCYFYIPRKAERVLNYLQAVRPSETIMPGP